MHWRQMILNGWRAAALAGALLAGEHVAPAADAHDANAAMEPISVAGETDEHVPETRLRQPDSVVDPAMDPVQFQQALTPQVEAVQPPPLPAAARGVSVSTASAWGVPAGAGPGPSLAAASSFDAVLGAESTVRATTDVGNLLGASPSVLNLGVQRRNPIVSDPRVRSSQVGSLAASGSYWVPARIDLDTMVSKLDSRIIDSTTIVPGPYSALYGPGLQFIDVQLRQPPRYAEGFEAHGQSIVDFKTNGEQWHGRQNFWGGGDRWGFIGGYGHRTGNDYAAGDGRLVPSSYKSRDTHVALANWLSEDSVAVGDYMRLDQTDVELPGQAFDIDFLYVDAYEVELTSEDRAWCDRLDVSGWYNRTVLAGSAQRAGKRATFPYYDEIGFVGFTDVDSTSTGFRAAASWGDAEGEMLTAGADLRYIEQQLNELTSGNLPGFPPFIGVNSPIPDSFQVNPGLFAELTGYVTAATRLRAGARVDFMGSEVTEDLTNLQMLTVLNQSAADILGSGDFERDDLLGLGYLALDHDLEGGLVLGADVGYAERAPNLTELYAVQPFMFLLQNGLNTVTGDPTLDKIRQVQTDVRLAAETEYTRTRVVAHYAWAFDYITFENIGVVTDNANDPVQTNLKFVNTQLATLWGVEQESEVDLTSMVSGFVVIKYTEGEDRTRNGEFATAAADGFGASERFPGMPRGAFSGFAVPLPDVEPLPSILPLESRIGLRIGNRRNEEGWGVEVSTRIVDNQDRVAASLLETPTPGFTTWDLRAFWRPQSALLLLGGVENFTDKHYREHLDFRSFDGTLAIFQPGVNFYFGGELTY